MKYRNLHIGLMLVGIIASLSGISSASIHAFDKLRLWDLAGRDLPTSTASVNLASAATPCTGSRSNCVGAYPLSTTLPCSDINDTSIVAGSENNTWTLLCNIDFFAQDIYPFLLTNSFEDCLQECENYNQEQGHTACVGFVFAPDRARLDNDCYLKSSVTDVVYPSTIHLVGATLVPQAVNPLASSSAVGQPTSITDDSPSNTDTSQAPVIDHVVALGASSNVPTEQYVKHTLALPQKLASDLLTPGINTDLITKYPLAHDTGSWKSDSMILSPNLGNMSVTPRLSRDGGKGGVVNGTYIFVFCDTSTYGDTQSSMGYMNGLVSSSAAIDLHQNAIDNQSLSLQDPMGQWQDNVGRLRGWIELTTGEEAFNIALSGDGYRYAVWPESSPITLNITWSLIYASLVYLEVNMTTQIPSFTTLGNSLVAVSTDFIYGPYTTRLVNQLFTQTEVQYGSLGGLRAWGPNGIGAMDGNVYLFGQVDAGILVARVEPHSITDRSSYTYWDGSSWTSQIQTHASPTTAYMINQPVLDFDVFYSPFHRYFIMVYLTPYADNTFWFRYSTPPGIVPPYINGSNSHDNGDAFWGHILHGDTVWSKPYVLWKPDPPKIGYIYAGGVHAAYFGANDITEGGNLLLITWTQHTERDPSDPASGYAHMAAKIRIT